MPRILDNNIEQQPLPALRRVIEVASRGDSCVGYFNLRGWRQPDRDIERWARGEGNCCCLLVGMQRLSWNELRGAMSLAKSGAGWTTAPQIVCVKTLAEEFRDQSTYGFTDEDLDFIINYNIKYRMGRDGQEDEE